MLISTDDDDEDDDDDDDDGMFSKFNRFCNPLDVKAF